jgi:hypothetical protein
VSKNKITSKYIMPLTEDEIVNLRNDGVFGNVADMNRLNGVLDRLSSRDINMTYDNIKEETQFYIDEHYPNKLIIDLTEDEKNNVAQNVINKLEDMILEPLIPADNNWIGGPGDDVLLGGRKRKSRRGTKRKSRRGTKRKSRRGTKRKSRRGTKRSRKGSKRRRR